MKVEGTHSFEASREAVYRELTDPEALAASMPGVSELKVIDETHWRARVASPIGLGPSLWLAFEIRDRRSPDHAALHAEGNAPGAGFFLDTEFDLDENGGRTTMRWSAELRMTGLLGRRTSFAVGRVARRQTEALLDGIERRLAAAPAR